MPLDAPARQTANRIYQLARAKGIAPARALELVSAAHAESSLVPTAVNKSSGAAGLFQLLSPGYRQRAQTSGGLFNVDANTNAILPDYQNYWRTHPNAAPGEAGRDVERSGQGAGFYSKALPLARTLVAGAAAPAAPSLPAPATPRAATPAPAADWTAALRTQPAARPSNWVSALRTTTPARTAAPAQAPASWVDALAAKPAVAPTLAPASAPATRLRVQVAHPDPVAPAAAPVIAEARKWLGTPYSWGGGGPAGPSYGTGRGAATKGFDCSGFVAYLAAKQGVQIPRTTYDQWAKLPPVQGVPQPGDLVFFEPSSRGPGHVGLAIGQGQFIESPHTGATIRISRLADRGDYMGARRI